jgi:hypothetical protein
MFPTLVVYHLVGKCQRSRWLFSSASPTVTVLQTLLPILESVKDVIHFEMKERSGRVKLAED